MKIGLDIGSTTIKCVVLNDNDEILHKSYERHYSQITEKIREILQNAYFVLPKPEAFQEGLSTVNQILQELETGGYAVNQDFVEAKSAAVCAKIILSEVLNENDA